MYKLLVAKNERKDLGQNVEVTKYLLTPWRKLEVNVDYRLTIVDRVATLTNLTGVWINFQLIGVRLLGTDPNMNSFTVWENIDNDTMENLNLNLRGTNRYYGCELNYNSAILDTFTLTTTNNVGWTGQALKIYVKDKG